MFFIDISPILVMEIFPHHSASPPGHTSMGQRLQSEIYNREDDSSNLRHVQSKLVNIPNQIRPRSLNIQWRRLNLGSRPVISLTADLTSNGYKKYIFPISLRSWQDRTLLIKIHQLLSWKCPTNPEARILWVSQLLRVRNFV